MILNKNNMQIFAQSEQPSGPKPPKTKKVDQVKDDDFSPIDSAPSKPQKSQQPQQQKQQAQPKKDSQDRAAVRAMQGSILRVKESLEGLQIGNPQDSSGNYNRGQQFDASQRYGHDEEFEMEMGNDASQVNRDPRSFKRNEFQRKDPSNESLDGTNPIGNFLLKNYIKQWGVQFTDLDVEQPERMTGGQGAMEIKNFKALVDTVGHIGTPKPPRQKSKEEDLLEKQLKVIENNYPKYQDKFDKMNNELASVDSSYRSKVISLNNSKLERLDLQKSLEVEENKKIEEQKAIMAKYQREIPDFGRYEKTKLKLSQTTAKLDKEYYKPKLGEESTDGIWDVRTNNALKNILSIMNGFMSFAKDMKISLRSYNQKYFDKLKESIPVSPTKLTPEQKYNQANVVSSILSYFSTTLIPEIKSEILESPKTANFINQSKSFFAFNKTKSQQDARNVDAKQKQQAIEVLRNNSKEISTPTGEKIKDGENYFDKFQNSYNPTQHIGMSVNFQNKQIPVMFQYLTTPGQLSSLYKQYFQKTPTQTELKDFLNQIKQQLTQKRYYKEYKESTQQTIQSQ